MEIIFLYTQSFTLWFDQRNICDHFPMTKDVYGGWCSTCYGLHSSVRCTNEGLSHNIRKDAI